MNDKEVKSKYYELANQGKREEGIAFLEEYIEKAGDNVSADLLAHTGNVVLLYLGELEKGIDYFHRAIEKEPENPDIYWSYFTDLDEITDKFPETIDDAILCLTKVIEYVTGLEPEKTANITTDNATKKQYKYGESIDDDYKKEVNIARRYRDLAEIYLKIPNYEKAEECVDKTLAIQPDSENAILTKNKILVATGREPIQMIKEEDKAEKEIKLDETITDPFLKVEEIVSKIDYNGHRAPIPEEWMRILNELTGNEWTEEEYKLFCVELQYTLEETVYALFHDGEYPDWVENELHFIRPLDKSVIPTLEVCHKLCVCDINDSIRKEFEELPVVEIETWFTEYFASWKKEVEVKPDKEHSSYYEFGETTLYFEYTGEREYGYEKRIGVSMSNDKMGFVWSKNLTAGEWNDVVNFFKNSGGYTIVEE